MCDLYVKDRGARCDILASSPAPMRLHFHYESKEPNSVEGPRTMVGIATFDSTIHFYNLKRALQQV
ncbi:hypothetical protein M8C21_002968 [Ambrosia artemisiifolia]|uniref:Uncharacterized protein n=1 Tax=Ambrosia artemisiifolia TaxID=4212 RepID=A0AAD5GLE9_AMBAR|nr:hypothetical protein M8C21_002968 [Ambrosia artemisiifolia]